MRSVTPRFLRPRLLLLPLMFGVLLAPAYLTTSAVPVPVHEEKAGTMCSNLDAPDEKMAAPSTAPHCVNCRAPLLNAPLARADHEATTPIVALPPAA